MGWSIDVLQRPAGGAGWMRGCYQRHSVHPKNTAPVAEGFLQTFLIFNGRTASGEGGLGRTGRNHEEQSVKHERCMREK